MHAAEFDDPPEPDFRRLFESAPGLFLVLRADAPRFTVVAVSNAGLQAAGARREQVLGHGVFEVLPDNPGNPQADGVAHVRVAFDRVLRTGAAEALAVQRHDLRRVADGAFEERWWSPQCAPVLDEAGLVAFIILRVEDVTALVGLHRASDASQRHAGALLAHIEAMQTEVFLRARQLRETAHRREIEAEQANAAALEARVAARTEALERSTRALELSEARLRGVFESATDAILTVDESHRILMANSAASRVFGHSLPRMIGQPLDILMPARSRAAHPASVKAFGNSPMRARHMNGRIVIALRADGTEFPVDAAISHLEVGGKRLYTVILRDITEQRRAEADLQSSRAILEAALASMSDAVLIVDNDGRHTHFNEAFANFHRFRDKSECPRSLEDYPLLLEVSFTNGKPAPLTRWAAPRALCGETASGAEYLMRRKDTGVAWCGSFTFGPIRDAAGAIVGAVIVARDITESRQTEQALRESERRLRQLLMLLPEAVFVSGVRGIAFLNVAAQRLVGLPAEDVLGRSAAQVLPPDSMAVDPARLAALATVSGAAPLVEERVVRADGAVRIVETTATPIDDHGEPSVLAIMRDITDLKQAQSSLLQAHTDLQRLLASQDEVQEHERKRIARELHDDLQQTLAAIRMDLSAVAECLPADPHGAAGLLQRVDGFAMNAIASTRRIVNDLRPQLLEDLGLVPALELIARQFAQRSGVACEFRSEDGAGEALTASPAATTCLYRVAQEALNNVAKHAAASDVRVRLGMLPDGRIRLRIEDNGRGMQADDSRRVGAFGLLGMRERLRAVGGVLQVQSRPQGGTTVEAVVAAAAPPSGASAAAAGAGWRVPSAATAARPAAGGVSVLLQGLIDALDARAVVLDPHGTIRAANRAWNDFARSHGDPELLTCGAGVNYLEVCRRSEYGDAAARRVLEGLQAVLEGRRPAFATDYPCDVPGEPRWFRMHAAPLADGGVLVTHVGLTASLPPEAAAP